MLRIKTILPVSLLAATAFFLAPASNAHENADHSAKKTAGEHAGAELAEAVPAARMAPDFTLNDENGEPVTLSSFKGKVVVLEWTNPDCPFVKMHYDKATTMVDTQAKYAGQGVVWLAINSTHYNKPEDTKGWAASHDMKHHTLQDPSGDVGRLYGAKTTPHMFVINGKGEIAYEGAIDNYMSKEEAPVNYVDSALANVLAGEPVAVAETRPYGCSVKYAKK